MTTDHAYTEDGNYLVTLTVTDNEGATDTATTSISVTTQTIDLPILNISPVASFVESAVKVISGEIVYFDGYDSYDSDGTIDTYSWNFGDGNTATGMATDHTYVEDGIYTVTLTVTDNEGATDTATTTIGVQNQSPEASFIVSADTITLGESINFDGSESFDSDGTIVSYSWDFGDGNTATVVTTDHTYNKDGTYTVTLIVTDNDGDLSSSSTEITVQSGSTQNTESSILLYGIGLGITALVATLLISYLIRRKKKKRENN
jgi:PKD repeat protein